MKINDAGVNKMTTADDTDIIPIARNAYPYPASITVKNIRDALLVSPVTSGKGKHNTTLPDSSITNTVNNGYEINGTLPETSRNNNVISALGVNAKAAAPSNSDCVMYATSSFMMTDNSNTSSYAGLGGYYAHVTHYGGGNISQTLRGVYAHVTMSGSGTVTQAYGLQALMAQTAGTVTQARCVDVRYASTGGSCTTAYGVFVGDIAATTAWGLYVQNNDSYFGGKVLCVDTPEHADNAAAIAAGLVTGTLYRTGDTLKVVH